MKGFETARRVRFADCDPAGIIFFPQYLVMMTTLVEQWFDEGLRIPYAELLGPRRIGLPTVRLEVDFTAVSRFGDDLALRLEVERVGRSSLALRHEYRGGGTTRLRARQVIVATSLADHRPVELAPDIRAAIGRMQDQEPQGSP
ncbi:MAG: acyl-CoA thioesterase [Burkholderiales bacterium]|nr:acyl-CoA thioesterase [Burkholderiales bacterium]